MLDLNNNNNNNNNNERVIIGEVPGILTTFPIYQVGIHIKIEPTEQKPYELEYKIDIHDDDFEMRLKKLQDRDYIILKKVRLFGYSLKIVTFDTISNHFSDFGVPPFEHLFLVDTPATIRFYSKTEAERYRDKFVNVLKKFLNRELKQHIKVKIKYLNEIQ